MPYIGHSPTNAGTFYILDALTMSSSTTYTMQVGSIDVTPNVDNLLITLDGVIQHPSTAYTVSGSTLTFDTAPGSGVEFYGVVMGQSASFGEGSIGADELKVTGDGSSGQVLASDGDGTFTWTTDTENYLPLAGGAMTGAITTNSTFDGVDIATRDAILTSTTTTAGAALPKAGGTMTGHLILTNNSVALQCLDAAGTAARVLYQDNGDTLIIGNPTTVDDIRFDVDTYGEGAMTILSSGNVGIGTTAPLAMLDIKGDTDTWAGMAKIYLTDASSSSARRKR
jgi:hypothetical protein